MKKTSFEKVAETRKSTINRLLKELSEVGLIERSTDEDGKILVTDSLNFRVQIFSSAGKYLDEFGEAGQMPGFFSRPKGIANDSDGNIYVVDALFDNIQIFSDQGTLLMDYGGPGQYFGKFWLPSGIAIDNTDKIYVADTYNKRIQIFQYLHHD